jgi:hypothetical protein
MTMQPLDPGTLFRVVDAGFKWLCGPCATGFCCLSPDLAERVAADQAYWLAT